MEILIDTPHWLMRQLGERHGQPWGYIHRGDDAAPSVFHEDASLHHGDRHGSE